MEGLNLSEINRKYYSRLEKGRGSYWNYMAGPLYRRKVIIHYIDKIKPASICDFGCGNGALLNIILEKYPEINLYGLDLSPKQIEENKKNYSKIMWHCDDISNANFNLPWEIQFDYAISSETIEHIYASDEYLYNIWRYLKKNGHLFLTTQSGTIYPTEKHVGHFKHWSVCEIKDTLTRIGFSNVLAWNEGFPFHNLSKYLANVFPEKTIQSFGVEEYRLPQKMICLMLRLLFVFNSKKRGNQVFVLAKK